MNFNFVLQYSLPAAAIFCVCVFLGPGFGGLYLSVCLCGCACICVCVYGFDWLAWLSCNSLSSELIRVEKICSSWRLECHRVGAWFVWSCLNRDHQKVIEWNEELRDTFVRVTIYVCICVCVFVCWLLLWLHLLCDCAQLLACFLSILLFDFYQS